MLCKSLIALCLAATACSHQAPHPRPKAVAAAAPKEDPAQLNGVDVRLLTEALAYDVTHAPWLQGLRAVQTDAEVLPQVTVGTLPRAVPPSGAPFPGEAFAEHLVQALRNTHRVEVLAADAQRPAGAPALWQLDIAATHDSAAVEGDMSRGYRLDAVLRLTPSNTQAWAKSYTLRKRVRPEAKDVEPHTER